MRICYFAPAHSIHTQRWLQAFVNLGHEVHLIALPDEPANLEGVNLHRLPIGRPKIRFFQWLLASRRIIQQIRPDIVHGHYITRYGWLAALTLFRPLVLTAWGTDIYIDPARSRLTRWLTRWVLQRANLITVDAVDLRERITALGTRPDRVALVQWGVDTRACFALRSTRLTFAASWTWIVNRLL